MKELAADIIAGCGAWATLQDGGSGMHPTSAAIPVAEALCGACAGRLATGFMSRSPVRLLSIGLTAFMASPGSAAMSRTD